ncbi:hypothetical protein GF337_07715, partial [candidate division KSB1 bacterium]|nr:hypothetical protein [candidate division KSB1 bacterium]
MSSTKTEKKQSLFRRLLKVFLLAAAIFVLLSIAALIVLRIQYPPEKVKQLIESELSSSLNNRSVTIENANLNILKGFGFDNLIVYNHPDTSSKTNTPADSSKFIFIKKIFLNYDLLSLLRRNVKIRTIEIDHPVIYYTSHHDKTNIDDMLEPSTEDTIEVVADTSEADVSLPISFELDKFEFKHFDAYLTITTDTSSLYAEISDFSIYMTDLELPRGEWMDVRDSLWAKAKIESPESAWKIRLENPALSHPYQITSLFDLDIDLLVDGIRSVNAAGNAGMRDVMITENISKRIPASELFRLQFDLNLDTQQGDVDISELKLDLADENLFVVKGSGKNLYEQPYLDVRVENSEIRLSKIFSNVKSIVPS